MGEDENKGIIKRKHQSLTQNNTWTGLMCCVLVTGIIIFPKLVHQPQIETDQRVTIDNVLLTDMIAAVSTAC